MKSSRGNLYSQKEMVCVIRKPFLFDYNKRDCLMLRAEQTPDKAHLEKQGEDYNLVDWHLNVLRKYKDKLLCITRHVVADAWLSKVKFVNEACLLGFHVVSRLRDDAAFGIHMTAFE